MNIFTNETNINLHAFKKGIRIDGRNFLKNRTLTMIIGPKKGLCDICQGGTRVIISSFVQPISQKENGGNYSACSFDIKISEKKSTTFSNSINFFNTTNNLIVNEIKKILNYIFTQEKTSYLKDFSPNSEGVNWITKFKIFILENKGNLKDIITLGISLINSSNNFSKYIFNGQIFDFNLQFDFKRLPIHTLSACPLSFSFVIMETLEGEHLMLFDPTNYEEYISICKLTIILSAKNEIKYIISGIGPGLNENNIKEALRISLKRNYEIRKILKNVLIKKKNLFKSKETILVTE
nr:ribosomal protein S5 domain 2-like protein [Cryptomonas curvata]